MQDQPTTPFEGLSDRVTDGTDQEQTVAYGDWLKRLRDNVPELDAGSTVRKDAREPSKE